MHNLIDNDHGGVTYAPAARIGLPEHRSHTLADVRVLVDAFEELVAFVREGYKDRYPVPDRIDHLLHFSDYAMARVRSGTLKRCSEVCD